MKKSIKYRFITMLVKHCPMQRANLTRRALGQIRQLNMTKLKRMLANCKREKLITIKVIPRTKGFGQKPELVTHTKEAVKWLEENEK